MNVNKFFGAGNLTRDPQLSYTPAQMSVCDFGLAINSKWKGKDGQDREETCFVDCRAFGPKADAINTHFHKGKAIFIEGKLHFSAWEGKDNKKHSKLRVTVDSFQFIGPKEDGQPAPQPAPQPQQRAPQAPAPPDDAFDPSEDASGIPF